MSNGAASKAAEKLFFDPRPNRTQVWNYGGGTQTAAIAGLICLGVLPKPDLSVFIDTGREVRTTMPYLTDVVQPALSKVGVTVEIVRKEQFCGVDLTSRDGKSLLVPAFTTQTGTVGKMPAFCTGEWKRDSISRWMRAKGVKQCDAWIGFSTDEIKRLLTPRRKWIRHIYPLIGQRFSREKCIRFVTDDMGWPKPPRSRCWMCANQSDEDWQEMHPDDFAQAVEFQKWMQKDDPEIWLHPSAKPLDQIDFTESAKTRDGLFSGCPSGGCFL